ncbi:uncharacterized protein CMC5_004170 [Chondromyces crocatus]|uniref:Uncharacterized protein n=1 Tax=Chondromyces crocatus TaxID=52 RepID=A0A0K1E6U7_CHOCO|nr:uncharacterized protein CMC5_004170 [Chondromyces crocatus]
MIPLSAGFSGRSPLAFSSSQRRGDAGSSPHDGDREKGLPRADHRQSKNADKARNDPGANGEPGRLSDRPECPFPEFVSGCCRVHSGRLTLVGMFQFDHEPDLLTGRRTQLGERAPRSVRRMSEEHAAARQMGSAGDREMSTPAASAAEGDGVMADASNQGPGPAKASLSSASCPRVSYDHPPGVADVSAALPGLRLSRTMMFSQASGSPAALMVSSRRSSRVSRSPRPSSSPFPAFHPGSRDRGDGQLPPPGPGGRGGAEPSASLAPFSSGEFVGVQFTVHSWASRQSQQGKHDADQCIVA